MARVQDRGVEEGSAGWPLLRLRRQPPRSRAPNPAALVGTLLCGSAARRALLGQVRCSPRSSADSPSSSDAAASSGRSEHARPARPRPRSQSQRRAPRWRQFSWLRSHQRGFDAQSNRTREPTVVVHQPMSTEALLENGGCRCRAVRERRQGVRTSAHVYRQFLFCIIRAFRYGNR